MWLPKTFTSVQLQPNIAELWPAIVTYSPSNHSPQYKYLELFLCLVLSKFNQKLDVSDLGKIKFYFFASLKQNKKLQSFETW